MSDHTYSLLQLFLLSILFEEGSVVDGEAEIEAIREASESIESYCG